MQCWAGAILKVSSLAQLKMNMQPHAFGPQWNPWQDRSKMAIICMGVALGIRRCVDARIHGRSPADKNECPAMGGA
eukprot:15473000-Alexandrium_andersonii.AAC.1